MPHGDIVLDDIFFDSIRDFRPFMSMGELRSGCQLLLKLVTSLRQDGSTQRGHKGTDEKLIKTAPLLCKM